MICLEYSGIIGDEILRLKMTLSLEKWPSLKKVSEFENIIII